MRFLLISTALFALASASPYFMNPGQVTSDDYDEFVEEIKAASIASGARISTGSAAKKGEYFELCYLSIGFYQKQQTCGCWLYDEQHVVTSARCVFDCSEGAAANVTVTFPALSGKDAIKKIARIYIPDGVNGAAELDAYPADPENADGNFKMIGPNNVAVIRLATKFTFGKLAVNKAKISEVADLAAFQMAKPEKDNKFRVCGIGVINNQGGRAKGVTCAEVKIIADPELCAEQYDPEKKYTPPEQDLCLQWNDRDNNACVGDYGGPVYVYQVDSKNAIKPDTQEVFCTLVGSPNVRKSAPCLDGHVVFCQHNFGPTAVGSKNALTWIKAIPLEP